MGQPTLKSVSYVTWLSEQVVSGLLYFFPVTALFSILFLLPLLFRVENFSRFLPVLASLILPAVIVAWGGIMRHDESSDPGPAWPAYAVWVLLSLQVIYCAYQVVRFSGPKIQPLMLSGLPLWIGFWSALVSIMSVTGDWM